MKCLKLAALAAVLLLPGVSRAQVSTQPFACGQPNGVWETISIRPGEYFLLPPHTTFIRAAHSYCSVASRQILIGPNMEGVFMVLRTNVAQQIPIYSVSGSAATVTAVINIDAVPTWDPSTIYTQDVVYYNGAYWVVAQPSVGIAPGTETANPHWLPQPVLQP